MNELVSQPLIEAMAIFFQAVTLPLGIALLAGLVVGVLQATTQIQDQTLPQSIKIFVVFAVFAGFGATLFVPLVEFSERLLTQFPFMAR